MIAALSQSDLFAEIERIWLEKGQCPTYSEFKEKSRFGTSVYTSRFGSWTKAVASYCSEKNVLTTQRKVFTRAPKASKEILLNELRKIQRARPGDLLTYDFYKNQGGTYSEATFFNHFGSWTKSVQAIGAISGRQAKYSVDDLFDEMQRVWEMLGQQPTYDEMNNYGNISLTAYKYRFGGWKKAVLAFCADRNREDQTSAVASETITPMPPDNTCMENQKSHAVVLKLETGNDYYEIRQTGRATSKRQRFRILQRDGFRCQKCGRSPKDHNVILHVDHKIAYSRGGETVDENLEALCIDCNLGKGDT
jgi:5-methylcytosine-specific restriction endonuclease McrA